MNQETNSVILIRDGIDTDLPFILSSFIKGLYFGDSWFSIIPRDVFIKNYKPVVALLLTKSVVKVACLRDDPNAIVGYSILSTNFDTIHWVYVKKRWRKNGIAKALLPQFPTTITHLTQLGKELMPKFKDCIFNPFKI